MRILAPVFKSTSLDHGLKPMVTRKVFFLFKEKRKTQKISKKSTQKYPKTIKNTMNKITSENTKKTNQVLKMVKNTTKKNTQN